MKGSKFSELIYIVPPTLGQNLGCNVYDNHDDE
jgi:hypothetical protein